MKQSLSGHDSMAYDVTYKRAISIIKEKGSIKESELRRLLLDRYGLPLFAVNINEVQYLEKGILTRDAVYLGRYYE